MKGTRFWLKLSSILQFVLTLYMFVQGIIMLAAGGIFMASAEDYYSKLGGLPFKFSGVGELSGAEGAEIIGVTFIVVGVVTLLLSFLLGFLASRSMKYSKMEPQLLRKRNGRIVFWGALLMVFAVLSILPEAINGFKDLKAYDYILLIVVFGLYALAGATLVIAGKAISHVEKKYADPVFVAEQHGHMQTTPSATEMEDFARQGKEFDPETGEYDEYGRPILRADPVDYAALKEIERLNVMRNNGVIDIQEYEKRKAEILARKR